MVVVFNRQFVKFNSNSGYTVYCSVLFCHIFLFVAVVIAEQMSGAAMYELVCSLRVSMVTQSHSMQRLFGFSFFLRFVLVTVNWLGR